MRAELRGLRGVRVKAEDVALRRQLADVPAKEILRIVARELKLAGEDLKRQVRGDWRRPLAAYLLQKYGGLTQREVGLEFGLGTGSAVSVQVKRFKAELVGERHCARALARIEKQLAS
jgi:chromosomal replication initiation ATPase DnaA